MTTNLSLITEVQTGYLTPTDLTVELKSRTGLNLYELMAEAVSIERQNMLSTGNTTQYIKILVPIFNKYAVPAPQTISTPNPLDKLTAEDLEKYKDNLITRVALSTRPKEFS